MKCPKCDFENPAESSYCMNCGTRLDGKIMCPNCRSLAEPTANNCPNCGAKLPKERHVEETEKFERFKANRKRKDPVWQIVFTAIFVGLLALSLLNVFGFIIDNPNDTGSDLWFTGTGLFYLTFEWGDAIKKAIDSSDGIYKFNYIFLPIFRFVICLINVGLTYSFGIIGIVKGINQLKKKRECKFTLHYYVAAVVASNVITGACLLSTYSWDVNMADPVSLSTAFDTLMSVYSLAIFVAMIYNTIYRFDNKKISLFVQNILFSLGFGFCISILTNTGNAFITVDNTRVGILDMFRDYIRYALLESGDTALTASICSGIGTAYVMEIIIRMIGLIYIVFFTKGFFLGEEENIKVKLPCYFGSIVLFTLSLIVAFLTVGVAYFYKADLLGYTMENLNFDALLEILKNKAISVNIGGGVSSMLSLSFLLVGTSMSSFLIVKTYKKNMKIIDARKVSTGE